MEEKMREEMDWQTGEQPEEPAERPEVRPQEERQERRDQIGGVEPVDETGVIAAHTKVTGDIVTRGHLIVYGEVEGNITAAGNVTAAGSILGDITCSNLKLAGCRAKSNLTVRETVIMDEASKVEGKICCKTLSVDGAVKGNIEASTEINIHSNASIVGGIRTASISVDAGAQIQGSINVVR